MKITKYLEPFKGCYSIQEFAHLGKVILNTDGEGDIFQALKCNARSSCFACVLPDGIH